MQNQEKENQMVLSRVLKFRAWDSITKTMFEPMDLRSSYARLNGFGSQGYILMQFTGLHDTNGKEIYEGDIIRSYGNNLGVIKYTKTLYAIGFIEEIFHWSNEAIVDTADLKDVEREWGRSEIIGNIYENPSLLSPESNTK